jgi:hypothetical protein
MIELVGLRKQVLCRKGGNKFGAKQWQSQETNQSKFNTYAIYKCAITMKALAI